MALSILTLRKQRQRPFGHFGGDADVSLLDRWGIIDPVTRHCHNLVVGAQRLHDPHLVLRRNTGKDVGFF